MNATQVLDTLEADAVAADLGAGLVASALAESAALRALDAMMYPRDPAAAARQRSRSIFDAWERWAADADALLRLVARLKGRGVAVPRADDLRREIAFARCVAGMTLEKIERARDHVSRGETMTAEEVRRELHSAPTAIEASPILL